MHPKEKITYFNKIFLRLMTKIPNDSILIGSVLIEFYTTALPKLIAISIKRVGKPTLNQTFYDTHDIEKEMMSIIGKSIVEDKIFVQPFRKPST